jgi:hypothetical protein
MIEPPRGADEGRGTVTEGGAAAADVSVAPAGGTASGGESSGVLAVLGVVASQVVIITALLYYFGWVRTHSFLSYFGIDPSMAGYGTTDYVLRSIKVAFPPFIRAAFTALVLFGLHQLMMKPALERTEPGLTSSSVLHTVTGPGATRPERSVVGRAMDWARALGRWRLGPHGMRWFLSAVHATGVALAVVVFIGVLLPAQVGAPLGLLLPLILVAAVTLLGYVMHLRSSYPAALASTGSRQATPGPRAYSLTLLALGLVAGLWAVGLYGDQVGTEDAIYMVDHLADEPGVTIYSIDRIAITGPGVVVAEITQPGTKYHYQYSGLRLLLHSSDKYLLLPVGWQYGQDRLFLLHEDDTIRVDITTR